MRGRTRALLGVVAGVLSLLVSGGVVHADTAGPTDFRSTIVNADQLPDTIDVRIVGGDSFVLLTADPGTDVMVLGYDNEPYLHFRADGVVEENRRSPTVYQNRSRYGSDDTPADADPTAAPEWQQVASGGSYAWHDHRSHWMLRSPPANAERGQQVGSGDIPLQVDGTPVSVSVAVTWAEAPSRLPLVAGAVVAVFLTMIVLSSRRRLAWILVAGGAAAAGIGYWQYQSLPAVTGPSRMWWLVPAVAAVSGLLAVLFGRTLVSFALVLLGGIELAIWVLLRRDGLVRALLPTAAPYWLDRGVTVFAAVAAVFAIAVGGFALFRLPTVVDD
jgi:hypothetical protein